MATALPGASLHPALAACFAVATLTLPALAQRGTDLLLLARHFADQAAADAQLAPLRFTTDALAALQARAWPGNAAELEQLVHRALLLADSGPITAACLAGEEPAISDDLSVTALVGRSLDEVERALILGTLSRCGGNRTSASAILGISVRTMRNKLRALRAEGLAA